MNKISHPPSWQPRLTLERLFTNAVGAGAQVSRLTELRSNFLAIEERYELSEKATLEAELDKASFVERLSLRLLAVLSR